VRWPEAALKETKMNQTGLACVAAALLTGIWAFIWTGKIPF